jgi:hypothetical protein
MVSVLFKYCKDSYFIEGRQSGRNEAVAPVTHTLRGLRKAMRSEQAA